MFKWKKLWAEFDEWFYSEKCDGEWDSQIKKIQQLVRKYQKIKKEGR